MTMRRILRALPLIVTAATIAAPVACAHHAAGEDTARRGPTTTVTGAASMELDRLGPKHVTLHKPATQPPVAAVRVVGNGFHWREAGLGAGIAAIGLGIVAALTIAVIRRTRRPTLSAKA